MACALASAALLLSAGCNGNGSGGDVWSDPSTPGSSPSTPSTGPAEPVTGAPGATPGSGTSGPTTPASPQQADVLPTPKRTLVARSLDELRSMISAAVPGDRIELVDGTYTNSAPIEVSVAGTEADPVVITAQNVGGATISGTAGFTVSGASHVILRGFKLAHEVYDGHALEVQGSHHLRITRNEFAIRDTTDSSIWLRIDGPNSGHNRIDHNFFHDKPSNNVFLALYGTAADGSPAMSQYDRIDHNYFLSQTFTSEGGECIRVGDSKRALFSAHALVDSNLFEKCDGDPEVISSKTSDVTYRANTLRNNKGSLVLRHGNRVLVDANFIVGNAGGMRAYGHDHVIVNNYIEGNSGSGVQGTLVLTSGCTEADTGTGSDCSRPTGVTVAFNTLVGNTSTHLVIGGSYPLPPKDCRVENNLIQGDAGTLVEFKATPENLSWSGNILWGSADVGDIPSAGYTRVDPLLTRAEDGLFRLSTGSPAIGAAVSAPVNAQVTTDMDGEPRAAALDVGADQWSSRVPVRRPLVPADVGPLAP